MSNSETSEDESDLPTPMYLKKIQICNYNSPAPSNNSTNSVILGQISNEVLRVWSQLPEAIRLDPSLAVFQKEYNRVNKITAGGSCDDARRNYLIVNMSIEQKSEVPSSSNKEKKKYNEDVQQSQEVKQKPLYRYSKLIALSCCWLLFTIVLIFKSERIDTTHQISVPSEKVWNYQIHEQVANKEIKVTLEGSLLSMKNVQYSNLSEKHLTIWLGMVMSENGCADRLCGNSKDSILQNVSDVWILAVLSENWMNASTSDQRFEKIFKIKDVDSETLSRSKTYINLHTNLETSLPVSISYSVLSGSANARTIYAVLILIGLYVLIIFEIVHRTLAAMLASTASIGVLAALNERPTMAELISWVDMDTLLLLFSMMVLVAIVAETGIFDWLAVYAYKITGGKLWPLINTLCFFTAFMSSFLDNVTTVLLMTPVTIKLCEVMELNPVPVLTAMVIYSNIGGAITPVGDPPNVIISSNREVRDAEIDFSTFSLHMSIGVILVLIVTAAQFRFIFRNIEDLRFDVPQDIQELRHEIAIWQRAAASLSSYSKDENVVRETLLKKAQRLLSRLKTRSTTGSVELRNYKTTLGELQEKYPIRDKWLVMKSGFVLIFVITLFFLHSVPNLNLSLGWTALIGVLLLLILADTEDLDGLMARVEWSTLLFFASLFVLMEALSRLGLIDCVGEQTEKIILSVNEESRLAVAILLLLWVSAITSAFVDNVPLTTMMVRIATNLAQKRELGLPLQPLVWSLALGACMGGNGTLIGATANVVCMGVAEQHGYKFSFMQFFKVGFPIMITSVLTITIYLMIAHVMFNWNGTY